MESPVLNSLLGLISLLSFIWAFFSQQNRIIAIIIGFVLMIIISISEQNAKVKVLIDEQKRFEEKLKIHQQLIDIKADIKNLQNEVFKK